MLPASNYTQIPNAILDAMPNMKEAEMRVVLLVCRETLGWHRESVRLSFSDLERLTGLSRQGAFNGISDALEHGYITRTDDDGSYRYTINIDRPFNEVERQEDELFNEVEQEGEGAFNEVERKLFNEVEHTQIKDIKINTNTTSFTNVQDVVCESDDSPTSEVEDFSLNDVQEDEAYASMEKQDNEWVKNVRALTWVFYAHEDVFSLSEKSQKAVMAEAKRIFKELGFTRDDLREWYEHHWKKDWRYIQHQQRPYGTQVRDGLVAMRAKTKTPSFMGEVSKEPVREVVEDRASRRKRVLEQLYNQGKIQGELANVYGFSG